MDAIHMTLKKLEWISYTAQKSQNNNGTDVVHATQKYKKNKTWINVVNTTESPAAAPAPSNATTTNGACASAILKFHDNKT